MIPPPPLDPACDAATQRVEDAPYYRGVLHKLIGIGVALAEQLADAKAPGVDGAGAAPASDTAAAYDRITRSIRRSIMLAERLGQPAPVRAANDGAQRRAAARRRIIRGVEDAIQREAWGSEAESLRDELLERLDGPDLADDIDHRPADAIITDICRDLGIAAMPGTQPWQRRTPDDIAALCALAAGAPDDAVADVSAIDLPGTVMHRMAMPPGMATGPP